MIQWSHWSKRHRRKFDPLRATSNGSAPGKQYQQYPLFNNPQAIEQADDRKVARPRAQSSSPDQRRQRKPAKNAGLCTRLSIPLTGELYCWACGGLKKQRMDWSRIRGNSQAVRCSRFICQPVL